MTTLLTTELIERCHSAAKAKGFWDVEPERQQQLMLASSELCEAMEAHRKGKTHSLSALNESMALNPKCLGAGGLEEYFASAFAHHVKDSPADELADTYIRLCDFAGGFKLKYKTVLEHYRIEKSELRDSGKVPENFAVALWGLNLAVAEVDDASALASAKALGIALSLIELVAERFSIDLATHIDLKLRFNATRNRLHGKAY